MYIHNQSNQIHNQTFVKPRLKMLLNHSNPMQVYKGSVSAILHTNMIDVGSPIKESYWVCKSKAIKSLFNSQMAYMV